MSSNQRRRGQKMDRLRKAALLTRLIRQLRDRGSWCGETHVQKAAFLLQDLMDVPLGLDFILYKHGPFSFDLRDELTGMRADNLVTLESQFPYGPRLNITDQSEYIQNVFSKTLKANDGKISFVAEKLGGMGVAELERLATALFITKRTTTGPSVEKRAAELTKRKPHIPLEASIAAAEAADRIIQDARAYVR
jgi:hypothetical protein